MARLEQIRYTASGVAVESGALQRKKVGEECVLGRLPQVVWQNGAPWREANCSGLMKPDTHLGENARHIEVSDDQATSCLFR